MDDIIKLMVTLRTNGLVLISNDVSPKRRICVKRKSLIQQFTVNILNNAPEAQVFRFEIGDG